MPIEPSYDYTTFNTMGAPNGSGVELSDTWEDFRKKTNGLYNRLTGFGVAPKARGLITWTPSARLGTFGTSSFRLMNSTNVRSFSWSATEGFKINFENPTKDALLLPFGTLSSRDGVINVAPRASTSRKPDSNIDDRHAGDIGSVVFHSPTQTSINAFPYLGLYQDDHSTSYNDRAIGGLAKYKSMSFVVFAAL